MESRTYSSSCIIESGVMCAYIRATNQCTIISIFAAIKTTIQTWPHILKIKLKKLLHLYRFIDIPPPIYILHFANLAKF